MKILQIVKTSEGATWAYNQAVELKRKGIEIVTIIPDKDGKIAKRYIDNNMKIIVGDYSLPVRRPWKYFKMKKSLLKIIEEEQPDLIHFHFVTNILFARIALRQCKIPRLFQVPGPLHLENKLIRFIEIKLANENDYWAPACKFSRDVYKKYVSDEKVFLAYYGVDIDSFIGNYTISNKLHNEYKIKNKLIIAMVSYFYKPKYYLGQTRGIKGHEDFIDAINILNTKYNDLVAIIIGGPWGNSEKYEQRVKNYAKKKNINNIIFTGFRDDIKDIYKEFDVAVHPSLSENLGGAAESLAAAVPTVSTNVGGFPDIVINGKTGFLCKPHNPDDLANAISKALDNMSNAKKMAKEGQKLIVSLIDVKNTSQVIFDIYKKIINKE